jgi:hypothetical protein
MSRECNRIFTQAALCCWTIERGRQSLANWRWPDGASQTSMKWTPAPAMGFSPRTWVPQPLPFFSSAYQASLPQVFIWGLRNGSTFLSLWIPAQMMRWRQAWKLGSDVYSWAKPNHQKWLTSSKPHTYEVLLHAVTRFCSWSSDSNQCLYRVENNAAWFIKQPHCEAKAEGNYSVYIRYGSSSTLAVLATILQSVSLVLPAKKHPSIAQKNWSTKCMTCSTTYSIICRPQCGEETLSSMWFMEDLACTYFCMAPREVECMVP